MKHLIEINDLSIKEIDELIEVAKDIMKCPEKYSKQCRGKILATLFFEPSTRTRLSFESAMLRLGGSVLGFSEPNSSSASKGESVADTIRVVGGYSDIIVMRHPKEGAPVVAANKSIVPIINAGDGGHHHPTQTLTDLLTIKCEKGTLDNLTIGLCGDLKYGRTVHSLISAMSRYKNIKFILISPKELRIPEYIKKEILDKKNLEYLEKENLEENINELDILYMTRIQKERFNDEKEYLRLKDSYVLDLPKLNKAKKDLCIMHPLPRVNEISVKVDEDSRACYFNQAEYGKFIRMALILKLLKEKNLDDSNNDKKEIMTKNIKCKNPKCITAIEQELEHIFIVTDEDNKVYRCKYCDVKVE